MTDTASQASEIPSDDEDIAPIPHSMSLEEFEAKLDGYIQVPNDGWKNLVHGQHVRYISHAHGYRSGGFFSYIRYSQKYAKSTEERGSPFMILASWPNKSRGKVTTWPVAADDIRALYVRMTAVEMAIIERIRDAVSTLDTRWRAEIANRRF